MQCVRFRYIDRACRTGSAAKLSLEELQNQWREKRGHKLEQETRMLSQALNCAMPYSRNQLEEEVNCNEIIFYLAV